MSLSPVLLIAILGVIAIVCAVLFVKRMLIFLIHSVIGLFSLMGWNLFFEPVAITVVSVLLVAIFGIFGFVIVVILHGLGWAF